MRPSLLLAFFVMTVVTYFCRALFTVWVSKVKIRPFWDEVLSTIPLAILAALVTPLLFFSNTGSNTSAGGRIISLRSCEIWNPYSVAGAITFLISLKTRNTLLAASLGVVVFILIRGRM